MSDHGVLLIVDKAPVCGRPSVWDEALALHESGAEVIVVAVDGGVDELLRGPSAMRRVLDAGVSVAVEQGAADRRRVRRLPRDVEVVDMDAVAARLLTPGWTTVWR